MSIRTKLLAAIVGLNGAILILALFLFIQTEAERSVPFPSRAALYKTATSETYGGRRRVRALILDERRRDHWKQIYIYVAPGANREKHPGGIYTADAYYRGAPGQEGPQVAGAERERVRRLYEQSRRTGPFMSDKSGALVVDPLKPASEARSYTVIAVPRDPRGGAQTVYVVMIVGVILLTAVSFWLVSKLVIYPLRELSEGADRIAEGFYDVRLPSRDTGDELGRTVEAFNRMAEEIAEYQGHLEDRVMTTLTRVKKAEQHLAIAQRLAATGKLAAGLAHEINNPLGGLKNAVNALGRGDLSPEKTTQYLELVNEGLSRIEQTVKTFLSFMPRRVEPRRTDLVDVVEKAIVLAAHRLDKKGIEVATVLPDREVATVFGDDNELQQVVLNLLLNAADAIDGEDGRVLVEVVRDDEAVRLKVKDNGRGMSAGNQDRCFDIFFTTKAVGEGTGLGLAVVHNIVTNHGGGIDVSGVEGEGSTFSIRLPADDGSEAAEAQESGLPPVKAKAPGAAQP